MTGSVCVSGGLGFIGSHLCRALAARGHQVVALDRLSGDYAPGSGPDAARELAGLPNVAVVEADLHSRAGTDALSGAGAVVHLAALPGVRASHAASELWAANVGATDHVLATAGGRVLFASTSSVYGDAPFLPASEEVQRSPLNAYAASKVAAEQACAAAGDVVIARLFTVFGPGQRPDMAFARWIQALGRGLPIHWCARPGARREFTYVGDAVRGLIAALEHGRPGEAYNIAGCGSIAVRSALRNLESLIGQSADLDLHAPGNEALATAACGRKARGELGYVPQVGLREGLERQWRAALEAGRALQVA
jgi:UDP-glucuronate 4-epimerase